MQRNIDAVVVVVVVSGPRQQIVEGKSKSSAWLAHVNSIFGHMAISALKMLEIVWKHFKPVLDKK